MLIDLQPIKAYVKPTSNKPTSQPVTNLSINQSHLQPISQSIKAYVKQSSTNQSINETGKNQNLLINQSLCIFLKKQFSKIPGTSYETKFK